jgi:hypothetical protein
MNYYKFIILTFAVTALWDVVLRLSSFNYDKLPVVVQQSLPFIKDLQPYFKKHTLLAAALIAGFVGATTQPFILKVAPFPTNLSNIPHLVKFLTVSFIISALYGFLIKWSKLFPFLVKYYYDKLGVVRGMYHDGISGLIVQITLLVLSQVNNL